jgi:hypothetical protein
VSHRVVSAQGTREHVIPCLLLLAWLALVIFATLRHEYWRDEIRAWSLAGAAQSPLDLFRLIRYEGHPILWYLVLYAGRSLDFRLALPTVSIAIATGAMAIFMFRSPFPLWMKTLFLFSALPAYEYSVMARNYGISMLLLFLFATLYPRRTERSLALAFVLALLANTNIHSTILAGLLLLVWGWDEWLSRRAPANPVPGGRFALAATIVVLGLALAVIVVNPPKDTILTSVYSTSPTEWATAARGAVLAPSAGFATLLPPLLPWALGHVLLYLAVLGLLQRPALFLAALAALVALGVLFRVAYAGSYRHVGLYLCFLLSLYWIAIESTNRGTLPRLTQRLFDAGCYGALVVLILAGLYQDRRLGTDLHSEMSSSKAFGSFLNNSAEFHNAILLPEPDYFMESVPYYASNPIYLARERRFGTAVTWSSRASIDLSLGQLITAARDLKARFGRPVLVVLGHPSVATDSSGDIWYLYRKHFTWTPPEWREAQRLLTPVKVFNKAVGDENYRVYRVR